MSNETLRDFIDRREGEIKSTIKELRAELKELKSAKAALPSGDTKDAPTKTAPKSNEPTIKELCLTILESVYPKGMSANTLLACMSLDHGKDIERASLSPQLSRLKRAGDVNLVDGEWFVAKDEPEVDVSDPYDFNYAKPLDEAESYRAGSSSIDWDNDSEVPF